VKIEGVQTVKAERTIDIPVAEYKQYLLLLKDQGVPGGGRRLYEFCNELCEEWLDDPMYIYDWDEWDDVEIEEIDDD
jgi:hypothetical protein